MVDTSDYMVEYKVHAASFYIASDQTRHTMKLVRDRSIMYMGNEINDGKFIMLDVKIMNLENQCIHSSHCLNR